MKTKVENMISKNGNTVPNQFRIITNKGCYFQSYQSIIVFKPITGAIQLDSDFWNYSKTTSKYRNIFLNETTKETEAKIKEGTYILTNLN